MKNIKIILSMLVLMTLGLGACNDELAQPPVTLPEGGIGTGEWNNPMTTYQAGLGSINEKLGTTVWVKGYIVGFVDTNVGNVLKDETAAFSVPATVKTNILIAATPDERDWTKCVPVQLPSGDVRNALNLGDHPDNQGKEVCLYGQTGSKYCSAYGVRSVSDFNWGAVGIEPDPNFVLPIGSKAIRDLNFMSGMQGFTFDQGVATYTIKTDEKEELVTDEGFETWTLNSKYGFYGSGRDADTKINHNTDAMAISPVYDLAGWGDIRMNIHSAANYFNNAETFNNMCQVLVREDGASEWEILVLPIPLAGNSWTFSDSGYINLDKYAGKKIQIAFRYTSTESLSGTWEIDKMQIYGVPGK